MHASATPSEARLRAIPAAALAAAAWVAVVVYLRASGERFSLDYLSYGWQIVPVDILRADPFGSVWNLHIQPPLWNLLLGVVLRWSPASDAMSLFAVQLAFGAIGVASLGRILERFLRSRYAATAAFVLWLNPELLRGVFQPKYEVAVASGLTVSLLLLVRFVERPTTRRIGEFLGGVSVVVMTRSLYHPALVVILPLLLGWVFRSRIRPRQIVVGAALPVILVAAWIVKNDVLFGEPNMSSWFGMNLQRSVLPIIAAQDKAQLLREGRIGNVSEVGPFGDYDLYAAGRTCTPTRHHRSLTTKRRTDSRGLSVPNFNYECFLPLYHDALHDAVEISTAYPGSWVRGRLWSLRATYAISLREQPHEPALLRFLDTVFGWVRVDVRGVLSTLDWGTPLYGAMEIPTKFALSTAAAAIVAVAGSIWLPVRRRRRRHLVDHDDPEGGSDGEAGADAARIAAVCGAAFVTVYTIIVGAIGELGEQGRFRSMTDALAYGAALLVIAELVRSWRARRGSTAARAG